MDFHTSLKNAMARNRLTQRQVAQMAPISRSHLQRILDGDVTPGLTLATRLADVAGFRLSWDIVEADLAEMADSGPKK